MSLNQALRWIVDEAVEEQDLPDSRYLMERVCSDTIGAVVTAIRGGVAAHQARSTRRALRRWRA